MAAKPEEISNAISADPLEQEYMLTATRPGHSLIGCEVGLTKALAVARGLALGGWRVRLQNSDPYLTDPLVMDVWSEDAP